MHILQGLHQTVLLLPRQAVIRRAQAQVQDHRQVLQVQGNLHRLRLQHAKAHKCIQDQAQVHARHITKEHQVLLAGRVQALAHQTEAVRLLQTAIVLQADQVVQAHQAIARLVEVVRLPQAVIVHQAGLQVLAQVQATARRAGLAVLVPTQAEAVPARVQVVAEVHAEADKIFILKINS